MQNARFENNCFKSNKKHAVKLIYTIIEIWRYKMASYLLPVEETRGVTQKLEKKVSKELITEDGYSKNLTLQT